jgi:predicted MPP superfamily phosphohydrolase
MSLTPSKLNRRRFLQRLGLIGAAGLLAPAADAKWLEPHWLKIRRLRIGTDAPVARFAYFTDLHYKGDEAYVRSVVAAINALRPDFVCFGGDLIEDARYLPAALALLAELQAPLYGVPGNHDYWSRADFGLYRAGLARTGGAWLTNDHRDPPGGRVRIIGLACNRPHEGALPLKPDARNVVLMHYPAWVNQLAGQRCDLMLAGHSHGGQVRIPFYGPLVIPFNVGPYDLGRFETESGPLYVNPGIGWFYMNLRFNCRPEVTVFEV